MIFVTLGTNEARFDRLLRTIASLSIDERIVVQHGHSSPIEPPNGELVDFLSYDSMISTIRASRVVVTHAGVGSVMSALSVGKRPVVVPRRRSFGEAVDDHQLELGRRFAAADLVTLVEWPEALAEALEGEQRAVSFRPTASSLAEDLRGYLQAAIA